MTVNELVQLFESNGRRCHRVGDDASGVVAGLDLEGRLFTFLNGEVVSKVNPDAFGSAMPDGYANPGGDGLWPAPEGTSLGYEYSTGVWRVPPGLVGSRFYVIDSSDTTATIRAEIDLVNNLGVGVPTAFERAISIEPSAGQVAVTVEERIEYLGARTLKPGEFLLAPWSLCQFDAVEGCRVVFPAIDAEHVWDLYAPSDSERSVEGDLWQVCTEGKKRFQIAMDEAVPWIEFRNPARNLKVRRTAVALPAGQRYIDIADVEPTQAPGEKGIRFSTYCDSNGFMEIEAVGGCTETLTQGTVLAVRVSTVFSTLE